MKPAVAPSVAVEETAPRPAFGEPAGPSDRLSEVGSLWQGLTALAHEQVQLAALETRRAGKSLIALAIAAVLWAVLVLSAWLGLLAAGVVWLLEQGVAASAALLVGVGVNLLAALMVSMIIRYQSRHLQFPATRRSLRSLSSRLWESH